MALTVAPPMNPGTLSVGKPAPTPNLSVGAPAPTGNLSVGADYGLQGGAPLPYASAPVHISTDPSVAAGYNQLASAQALLKSIQGPPAPVYAPKLDLAAINAQARAAAENNVNPFYVKSLNDFMTQQASEKAQQQAQTATNIQNLKDTLTNTQNANAVTGERTTADTATKEAQAAEQTDWRQTDQGGQFDMDRIAMAINQGKSGLTGSGIAAGQQGAAQNKFNTTESRQATTDAEQKAQTELSKARTFEDLATSNKLAGESETKGESQANVDLTNFITNQGFQATAQKNDLEQKRLGAVANETQAQAKLLINKFISSIANPAQRQAAVNAYGNAF